MGTGHHKAKAPPFRVSGVTLIPEPLSLAEGMWSHAQILWGDGGGWF